MENKKILVAAVLCFAFLIGWQYFAEYMGFMVQREEAPITQVVEQSTFGQDVVADANIFEEQRVPLFAPSKGRKVRVETPLYSAVFHSGGGVLESFVLKNYSATSVPDSPALDLISLAAKAVSPMGLLINGQPSWNKATWSADVKNITVAEGGSGVLVFEGNLKGLGIRRELTFHANTYLITEKIRLVAPADMPMSVRMGYTLAVTLFNKTVSNYDIMKVAWDFDGSLEDESSVDTLTEEGLEETGPLYWTGVMSNYFFVATAPASKNGTMKARIQNGVWRVAYEENPRNITSSQNYSVDWWLGPKDATLLQAMPNGLDSAIYMGIFGFLAKPLLVLLSFIQSFVINWGVAIILLTVIIKFAFWPLTRKSFRSMEQMKRIAPMMEEVKKKHGNDKEAMSREMMQLYKTYNVNPMSGCLPILVQLPVFVALYEALLSSIDLRHASFITYLPFTDLVWLADLSVKDPFYITPVLMGATMFLQQWLSPAVGDPMQRKIMMFMPLIFTFMFLSFPAGLVLYWLVNNLLSIAQQWWTLRKI